MIRWRPSSFLLVETQKVSRSSLVPVDWRWFLVFGSLLAFLFRCLVVMCIGWLSLDVFAQCDLHVVVNYVSNVSVIYACTHFKQGELIQRCRTNVLHYKSISCSGCLFFNGTMLFVGAWLYRCDNANCGFSVTLLCKEHDKPLHFLSH